jgi:spermidine/putrescine transport system permease protein
MPGLRTAFAFAFLLAAGDFVTPSLVGGSQSLLIGNIVADQFRGIGSNWPLGAAMAFVVVAVMLIAYLAVVRLIRWVTRW